MAFNYFLAAAALLFIAGSTLPLAMLVIGPVFGWGATIADYFGVGDWIAPTWNIVGPLVAFLALLACAAEDLSARRFSDPSASWRRASRSDPRNTNFPAAPR